MTSFCVCGICFLYRGGTVFRVPFSSIRPYLPPVREEFRISESVFFFRLSFFSSTSAQPDGRAEVEIAWGPRALKIFFMIKRSYSPFWCFPVFVVVTPRIKAELPPLERLGLHPFPDPPDPTAQQGPSF